MKYFIAPMRGKTAVPEQDWIPITASPGNFAQPFWSPDGQPGFITRARKARNNSSWPAGWIRIAIPLAMRSGSMNFRAASGRSDADQKFSAVPGRIIGATGSVHVQRLADGSTQIVFKMKSEANLARTFSSCSLRALRAPMRRSVCQRQNLMRFLLRKVFGFLPARPTTRPTPIRTLGGPSVRCTTGVPRGFGRCFLCGGLIAGPRRKPQSPKLGVWRCEPSAFPSSKVTSRGELGLGVPQRLVHFPGHPQPMQQHRQLSGHRDHRPLLRILAARARTTSIPTAANPYPARTDR